PRIHRELQLWVEAGLAPRVALQAATHNAARLLRADDRIGLIRKGYDASLLLVDGNPLQDIAATERISMVLFKGERVARSELFEEQGGSGTGSGNASTAQHSRGGGDGKGRP